MNKRDKSTQDSGEPGIQPNSEAPPPGEITNGSTPPDPFDLESLRLPQNFGAELGVRKVLTSVPVRRPDRQWFIRVHPTLRIETAVVELKDDNETYLVAQPMRLELPGEVVPKVLLLSVTRQGLLFFWPIRLPDETGRLDEWSRSAIEAAKLAEQNWVSVKANRHGGCYETHIATGNFPEPEWPDKSLQDLLRVAFRGRIIEGPDHAVVVRLRGL